MGQMDISLIGLLFIIFVSLGLGIFIAWTIRGKRIVALEKLLKQYQKKLLTLEMDHNNLEAFVSHLKEVNAERMKHTKNKLKEASR